MRIRVDTIFEGGQLSFEVAALSAAGDTLARALSRDSLADALGLAIASGLANGDPRADAERALAVALMCAFREKVGPAGVSA